MTTEKLSERMKPYCIFTKQFRLSPDEVMAEIQALEQERDTLKEQLEDVRALQATTSDQWYEQYESNRKEMIEFQLMITELKDQLECAVENVIGFKERAEKAEAEVKTLTQNNANLNIENDKLRKENTEFRKQNYPYSWEKLELLEVYKEQQAQRARDAEAKLAKAQELMKEFPCWELLDKEGLCIDPDQCASCEQEEGYGSPCWTGKMKRALGGDE
jgi:chromosome segregation ATPase